MYMNGDLDNKNFRILKKKKKKPLKKMNSFYVRLRVIFLEEVILYFFLKYN